MRRFAKFIESRTGNATIRIFNNFWCDPEEATRGLPKDQVAWGFPLAGGAFHSNVLRGAIFATVNFGIFSGSLTRSEVEARKLFRDCGFKISEKANFRDGLWIHFATNAGVMSQADHAGSMESVMGSFSEAREAALTLREILPVLRARGLNLQQTPWNWLHSVFRRIYSPEVWWLHSFSADLSRPLWGAEITKRR